MSAGDSETSVQVAVRVRPQNSREQIDMCRVCTFCTPDTPQIILGKDKAFTYDYVFDTATEQTNLYSDCVEDLVEGCFEGYNATVLAYGQTGSGKTYTMGSGFDVTVLPEEEGVIPRAVNHIFIGIEERRNAALEKNEAPPQFEITAQFLELYNEEIVDLFDANKDQFKKLRIHEDPGANIYVAGASEVKVSSDEETIGCLKRGALLRSVGSTNMNAQSSRSHAIFTLLITQQRPCKLPSQGSSSSNEQEGEGVELSQQSSSSGESTDWETLKAKLHFVDLAGSERLKRTGATGERAKEGISINCGLLALGNVISALGDKAKRGSHVPYRDSKLTRLLQDSLGGNSRTLMIACVSPTDRDFMETLNTLKYANRARNIKNKVVVNQDKTSQQLSILRTRIQELELELQEFKSGRMVVSEDGSVVVNDMTNEITMLRTENDKLRMRVKAMQQVIDTQSNRIAALAAEKELAALGHQDESTGQVLGQSSSGEDAEEQQLSTVIQGYMSQIEELKSRLVMSESLAHQSPQSPFRRAPSMVKGRTGSVSTLPFNQETEGLLEVARTNIQRLREKEDKKVSEVDLHASASQAPSSGKFKRQRSRELLAEGSSGGQRPLSQDGERKISTESGSDEESSNEDLSEEGFEDSDEAILGDSSEDTDSDGDETESLASSIAELSSEINIKQQLVDQLEKAQKNLFTMKSQYEEKMQFLQHQIKSVESERDKVLKEIVSRRGAERNDEKVKEVKTKYQRELDQLKAELKGLKAVRKEHAKAMKKNALHEKELKKLKDELLDMKKHRVKMMNKMREEASQKKVDDVRKAKEIAQLRKETRKKESKIQSLQTESRRREAVLKRKQEEISVLRRHNRYHPSGHKDSITSTASAASSSSALSHSDSISTTVLSSSTSGSGSSYSATVVFRQQHPVAQLSGSGKSHRPLGRRMSSVFSSDNAKKKWRELERKILDAINKRQTMSSIAKDMDHWIKKRDELSRKLDDLKKQKDDIIKSTGKPIDISELSSINEDLDSVSAHVEYVQENIVELQNDLIALDDAKSDGDTIEAHAIITSSSPREAKYLLEHLLDMVLNLGVKAGQKDSEVKSLRARLKASEQSAEIMKSMSSPQVGHPLVVNSRTVTKSKGPLHSSSTPTLSQKDTTPVPKLNLDDDVELAVQTNNVSKASNIPQLKKAQPAGSGISDKEATKWRRRTALPSEVAAGTITNNPPSSTATGSSSGHGGGGGGVSKALVKERVRQFSDIPSTGDTSATSKTDGEFTDGDGGESVRLRTGSGGRLERRKGLRKKAASSLEVPSLGNGGTSCPTSPSITHRLMKSSASETNVWARLANTGSAQDGGSTDTSRGSLQAERQDLRRMSTKLLTCTHTACGHSASVLSVHATQNLLFSASQDRTVKVWNLKTGTELITLDKHFSYVRCVRFCPKNSLIFTASQSLIKIWDMRHHRARCIKTFGPPPGSGPTSSETVVQDLIVSSDGETLYSAAGHFVNIWDLKKFSHRGRLVGHNGAVSALALKKNIMATGSRDRLIKLYELDSVGTDGSSSVSQPSVCTLYPPHYDAVSSFGVHGDLLFSSCGVTIKQWDMRERCLKQAVDGAHPQGNNINSLATLNSPLMPLLVSGCKGGLLKLWNPESCGNIGEVVAHKNSINAIATNDTCIFTGSSDKTIRVWRPCPQDS